MLSHVKRLWGSLLAAFMVVCSTIDAAVFGSRDAIVGFCVSQYDDGLLWLTWFGVSPVHHGTGLGTRLLDSVKMSLSERRAHKVWCDTRASNEPSARALTRSGFTRVAELKNHWYVQDYYIWEWSPR